MVLLEDEADALELPRHLAISVWQDYNTGKIYIANDG